LSNHGCDTKKKTEELTTSSLHLPNRKRAKSNLMTNKQSTTIEKQLH
jgi:hypothetical protein